MSWRYHSALPDGRQSDQALDAGGAARRAASAEHPLLARNRFDVGVGAGPAFVAARYRRLGHRCDRECVPGTVPLAAGVLTGCRRRSRLPTDGSSTALPSRAVLGRGRRSRPSYVTPGICSSEIARLPVVGSYGAALVMSSFSLVVVTGSKVIVDGMFDAPANVTCWLLTGAQPVPVQ